MLDLKAANKEILLESGIKEENIEENTMPDII